jgi:hypothetical protein
MLLLDRRDQVTEKLTLSRPVYGVTLPAVPLNGMTAPAGVISSPAAAPPKL